LEEEALLRGIEEQLVCPNCNRVVEKSWRFCAYCHTQVKKDCPSCGQLLELGWTLCPHCGSPANVPKVRSQQELPPPGMAIRPAPQQGELAVTDLPVVE
jgi:RNA polymerase subunit RPABC4/transcription elongation factor Spt4